MASTKGHDSFQLTLEEEQANYEPATMQSEKPSSVHRGCVNLNSLLAKLWNKWNPRKTFLLSGELQSCCYGEKQWQSIQKKMSAPKFWGM